MTETFTAVFQRDKAKDIQEDCATLRYNLLKNGRLPQSVEWDDNQITFKGQVMEDNDV